MQTYLKQLVLLEHCYPIKTKPYIIYYKADFSKALGDEFCFYIWGATILKAISSKTDHTHIYLVCEAETF